MNGVMAAAKTVSDVPPQTPRHDVMMARENVHDAPPLPPKSAIPVLDVFMDMKHGDDRTKPLELVVVMTAIVNDDPHLDPERTHWEAAPDHVLVLSNGLPSGTGPIQAVENAVQVDDRTAELHRSSDRVRSVIVLWILTSETESFSGIASGNVTVPERSNPDRLVGDVPQEHRGHSEIVADQQYSMGWRIKSWFTARFAADCVVAIVPEISTDRGHDSLHQNDPVIRTTTGTESPDNSRSSQPVTENKDQVFGHSKETTAPSHPAD